MSLLNKPSTIPSTTLKEKPRKPLTYRVLCEIICARNRTRTCTSIQTLVPETSASTNSAIRAFFRTKPFFACTVQGVQKYAFFLLEPRVNLIFFKFLCPASEWAAFQVRRVPVRTSFTPAGGKPVPARNVRTFKFKDQADLMRASCSLKVT